LRYIYVSADSPPGRTNWMTFERKIPGLPSNGDFIIEIYASDAGDSTVFPAIKNIRFYTTGLIISCKTIKKIKIPPWDFSHFVPYPRWKTEIHYFTAEAETVIDREYSVINSLNGEELKYDCLLGDVTDTEIDNVTEQFAGALAIASDLTPTALWNTRGGSENKALLQITTEEIATQYNRPKQFLDLPVLEITKAASALKPLGSFQDSINIFNNFLRVFVINRGTFDVKYRKYKFDLIEIGSGESTGGIPANALLNENGEPILNENGDYILTSD